MRVGYSSASASSIANQITTERLSSKHVTIWEGMTSGLSFMRTFPSYSVKAYIVRPHRSRRAFLFAVSSVGVPYHPCCRCIRYAIRPGSVKRTCLFDSRIGGLAWVESHTSSFLLSCKPLTGNLWFYKILFLLMNLGKIVYQSYTVSLHWTIIGL